MNQDETLTQILEQQKSIAQSLQQIADCLIFLTSEQVANDDAVSKIRWLGDGMDNEYPE